MRETYGRKRLWRRIAVTALGSASLFAIGCGQDNSEVPQVAAEDILTTTVTTEALSTAEQELATYSYIIEASQHCPGAFNGTVGANPDGSWIHIKPDGTLWNRSSAAEGTQTFPSEAAAIALFCDTAGE